MMWASSHPQQHTQKNVIFPPQCAEARKNRPFIYDTQNTLVSDTTVSFPLTQTNAHKTNQTLVLHCQKKKKFQSNTQRIISNGNIQMHKGEMAAHAHGQKQSLSFFCLLTIQLYISVYLTAHHVSLQLTDGSARLSTGKQFGFCSSPFHFSSSDHFCLPLRHICLPPSLSSLLLRWWYYARKLGTTSLKICLSVSLENLKISFPLCL